MRFGVLHLSFPHGRDLEVAVDQPSVGLGRASDIHKIFRSAVR